MSRRSEFNFNLFRAMEVFVAVVETRQVTKAAGLLGMTQSAASQHLRSLETALGARLLDRAARPIGLTRAGISLHRRAARILGEIEQLQAEVRRLEVSPLPVLRVGLLASIATTLTPKLIEVVRGRFQVPELTLHAGLASDHQELLANRRVDVVVTSDALYDVDGLERHALLREPFYLVLPPGRKKTVPELSALAEELPFVRFSAASPVGRRVDQHLRRVRLDFPRSVEADRASMVIAAVAAGRGFTFLTPTLLIDGIAEGLEVTVAALPIPAFSRNLTLVARARELGELPGVLAGELSRVLEAALTARLAGILPREGPGVDFAEAEAAMVQVP